MKPYSDRNSYMLSGSLAKHGYDWWWHNFTATDSETGEAKAFFIEYFIINPALAQKEPILGQVPEHQASGIKPSYAMIKCGAWGQNAKQIHQFYSPLELSVQNKPLQVKIGHCELSETHYIVSPKSSFGYADKNWGRDFTSPWLWMSSCHLISESSGQKLENSAFDFGGGRPAVFGIPFSRKLLGCLVYEGKRYEFNFSKFWTGSSIDFDFNESDPQLNRWKVIAKNRHAKVDIELFCPKADMLFMNYEAPDGKKRHNRLWNGGNAFGKLRLFHLDGGKETLIDTLIIKNAGCEYGEYDKES